MYRILCLITISVLVSEVAGAGGITIKYLDKPDEGFWSTESVEDDALEGALLGDLRRDRLQDAVEMLEAAIDFSESIVIGVEFEFTKRTVDGNEVPEINSAAHVSPNKWYVNSSGLIHDVAFLPSLASELTGKNLTMARPYKSMHGHIEFNAYFDDGHTGTRPFCYRPLVDDDVTEHGSCPRSFPNFTYVCLHEMVHSLGFVSRISAKDFSFSFEKSRRDSGAYSVLSVYDLFLFAAGDQANLMLANSPIHDNLRRVAVTGGKGSLMFTGLWTTQFSNAADDTTRLLDDVFGFPKVNTGDLSSDTLSPSVWSHLHSSGNVIMGPSRDLRENRRGADLGIVPGILKDLGWSLSGAKIIVIPTAHNFGSLAPDGSATRTSTVSNAGGEDLLVHSASIQQVANVPYSGFSIQSGAGAHQLSASASYDISVLFTATDAGVFSANLVISSDDEDKPEANVRLLAYVDDQDSDGDGIPDSKEQGNSKRETVKSSGSAFDYLDSDSTANFDSSLGPVMPDGVADGFNDYDGDGVDNATEFAYGLDPTSVASCCVSSDADSDGLDDFQEFRDFDLITSGVQNPFSPTDTDSDDNGVLDSEDDFDEDGLSNGFEIRFLDAFNPLFSDYSGNLGSLLPDGILDGDNDFDGDGISNSDEELFALDPTVFTHVDQIDWQKCPE